MGMPVQVSPEAKLEEKIVDLTEYHRFQPILESAVSAYYKIISIPSLVGDDLDPEYLGRVIVLRDGTLKAHRGNKKRLYISEITEKRAREIVEIANNWYMMQKEYGLVPLVSSHRG